MGNLGIGLFLLCFVAGLYLINSSLNFVDVALISGFSKWINLVAGILLVIAGFFLIKVGKKKQQQIITR